jgi:hypothetical protein
MKIYKEQRQRLMDTGLIRGAVYAFGDSTGWGNRLRGTYFVFFTGLISNRATFIDHDDWDLHFDDPYLFGERIYLGWGEARQVVIDAGFNDGSLDPFSTNYQGVCSFIDNYPEDSPNFETVLPGNLFVYRDGNCPEICYWNNPKYHKFIQETFGTMSRYEVMGQIVPFFLSNPTWRLIHATKMFRQYTKWDEYEFHVAIQFRAFVDHPPTQAQMMAWFEGFVEQSSGVLLDYLNKKTANQTNPGRVSLFWTSDDPALAERAKAILYKKLPENRVGFLQSPFAPGHTSQMPAGVKGPIVEWYMLGETDVLISTGTSYGQFAAARTGFKNDFYIIKDGNVAKMPFIEPYCNQDICT